MRLRLREAREEAGLTQTELAKRSGISRETINSLETGRKGSTSIVVLDALASAMHISPSSLFNDYVK